MAACELRDCAADESPVVGSVGRPGVAPRAAELAARSRGVECTNIRAQEVLGCYDLERATRRSTSRRYRSSQAAGVGAAGRHRVASTGDRALEADPGAPTTRTLWWQLRGLGSADRSSWSSRWKSSRRPRPPPKRAPYRRRRRPRKNPFGMSCRSIFRASRWRIKHPSPRDAPVRNAVGRCGRWARTLPRSWNASRPATRSCATSARSSAARSARLRAGPGSPAADRRRRGGGLGHCTRAGVQVRAMPISVLSEFVYQQPGEKKAHVRRRPTALENSGRSWRGSARPGCL